MYITLTEVLPEKKKWIYYRCREPSKRQLLNKKQDLSVQMAGRLFPLVVGT